MQYIEVKDVSDGPSPRFYDMSNMSGSDENPVIDELEDDLFM